LRRGFAAKSAVAAQSRRIASFNFTKPQCGRGLIAGDRRGGNAASMAASSDKNMPSKHSKKEIENIIQSLCVLVVDDNPYMRRMIRTLLVNCGVKDIYEATDGIVALDSIRTVAPDVVILDWEMPLLSGPELVRIVRSPGVFPIPDVPIIMLSHHGERWRVVEAVKLGVNEYLTKPVSAKSLYDRLVAITLMPRANVQLGDYYGPQPRKLITDGIEEVPAKTTPVEFVS
jgi:two-component system chemotaxis response regulator CheY